MRKIFPALILLLVPLNIVLAQGSPFGSLTGDDEVKTDAVQLQGQQVEDYVIAINEYKTLLDMYNRAYGDQKVVLEGQVLARAKDAMYSKLGAIETYLDALIRNADFYNQISQSEKNILEAQLGSYRNTMAEYAQKVQDAESLADMRTISIQFNSYLTEFLNIKNKHIARVSAVRGLAIIEIAMGEIDLMRFHLDSAAELGHDTSSARAKFDASMLKLEQAKDVYLEVQSATENVDILDFKTTKTFVNTIINTNREVIQAQEDLKDVVQELRTFFGQSPWLVDFQRNLGDTMMEESMENLENMEVENE